MCVCVRVCVCGGGGGIVRVTIFLNIPFFFPPPSLTLPCGLRLVMRGTLSPIVLNSSIASGTPALWEGGGGEGEGVEEGKGVGEEGKK